MNRKRIGFLTPSGTIAAAMTILIVVGIGFFSGGVLFNPGPLNAKSGASLGGVTSHAELASQCGSCHAPFWSRTSMADLCETCHNDIPRQLGNPSTLHGNLLKNNPTLVCRDCHPEHRGQNASLVDMTKVQVNHSDFGYSLAAHIAKSDGSVFACADCHTNGYTGFDQTICATCHGQVKPDFMQAHRQAYGDKCLGCHDGIDSYGHAFDHSLAAFQLIGKHAPVTCAQCHTGVRTIADMKATSADCYSCHARDDTHKGDLGTGCATCHSPAGWLPSTFNHDTTTFKLTGKHVPVTCIDCHPNNAFKGTPSDCYSCHAKDDAHSGDLGQLCATCHTTAGWLPANFDHNLAIFKLVGKHQLVPCLDCHVNNVFKGTPTDCFACHKKDDVHQGQLGSTCSACHTSAGWTPANFNHNSASFKLTGKHASAACSSCHKDLIFKNTPTECNSCHSGDDAHKGQLGSNCASCHTTSAWLPSTFNHNTSNFPLIGKHAGVSCASCHVNNVFKGTSTNCYSCHAKDDAHAGKFGTSCGTCHTPNGWTPASFDHSIVFPLTGAHGSLSCNSCHTNGGFTGLSISCSACHADPPFHAGLFAGTSCSSCHNTSSWTPASYSGSHPGGCDGNCINHENATCRDCHTTNLMTATCTKCHDNNNPGDGGGD